MANDDLSGREIRLLLLVIAVAVAVLLVLARFRFPEADIVGVTPNPNPLERIGTRSTFDDLAAAVTEAADRLIPFVSTIEFGPASASAPVPHTFVPALRVRPGVVLAHAPAGMSPILPAGVQIIALDADREVVLLAMSQSGQDVGPPAPAIDLSAAVKDFAGSSSCSAYARRRRSHHAPLFIRNAPRPSVAGPRRCADGPDPQTAFAWLFIRRSPDRLARSLPDGQTIVDSTARSCGRGTGRRTTVARGPGS